MSLLARALALLLVLSTGGAFQLTFVEESGDCAEGEQDGACDECCVGCTACSCCPVRMIAARPAAPQGPAHPSEPARTRLAEPVLAAFTCDIFRPPTA